MKQYVCIKDYITEDGKIAFKKGKIYDMQKNKFVNSEIKDISYYFPGKLKKGWFKKHKPLTSFGGNGLYIKENNNRWSGTLTANGDLKVETKDSIVQAVIKKFKDRSDVGIKKYGTTLDRKDINFDGWAEHLQQELMDGILYLERLRNEK